MKKNNNQNIKKKLKPNIQSRCSLMCQLSYNIYNSYAAE